MTEPRTALVTGVAGQDGVYLARLLLSEGCRVIGTVRPGSTSSTSRSVYLKGVRIEQHDIRDGDGIRRLLTEHNPDEVYNLAAMTSVGASWEQPQLTAETNAVGVERLLEALVSHRDETGSAVRLFQASSSEMTSDASESPYARSKTTSHELVQQYRAEHDLFACSGILYNHESPLRGRQFVTRKITRAAAEIACGNAQELRLGNVDVHRDWGAARDYVTAMRRILEADEPGDFVIGTGVSHSLEDVLTIAFDAAGLADPWRYVERDESLLRPVDTEIVVADPSRTQELLGWSATTTFEETIREMVVADLQRVRTGVEEAESYLAPSLASLGSGQ